MQLGIEIMGMAALYPGITTTNPGMGPGPQHVLLHIFKELLITPASPWAICVMHPSLTWHPHLAIAHQSPASWLYKA